MKKIHIKEKGITLISLVITIIILLILAGISITQLAENGLLGKSKLAKEESKRAGIIEYINLKLNEIEIDNYDKTNDEFMQKANDEFKKEEEKNSLKEYGKEITISDVIGSENNKFFYITIDNKIYEVKKAGATYKGESTEVDKPSIEVISGTEGDNEYYRSNVELQITQINTENLYKIKYKLEGAMTKEETDIKNGGTIEITEEGTTTIIVASYDHTNKKSEDVKLEIKKDSIAPNIELADANPSAREYSKKVIANITDNTSNVVSKKYAYDNQEINYFSANGTEFSNDFTVRTQDSKVGRLTGPSRLYTVYARDEAGNETIETISLLNLLIDNIVTGENGLEGVDRGDPGNECADDVTGTISFSSKGGVVDGPYWILSGGTYEVTYTGKNLDEHILNGYHTYENFWEMIPDATVKLTATSGTLVYEITVPENIGHVGFRCVFEKEATINNIRIKQL